MTKRETMKKKITKQEKKNEEMVCESTVSSQSSSEKMLNSVDKLLEEIDALLEPMGVEIIKNFIQQNGQ